MDVTKSRQREPSPSPYRRSRDRFRHNLIDGFAASWRFPHNPIRHGGKGGDRGRRIGEEEHMPTETRSPALTSWPELPTKFPGHLLVLLLTGGLKTTEHVSDWLDTVILMSGEQRAAVFRGKDGPV